MKRIALLCGIATALVASCSVEEKDFQTPGQENERFYATIEQPGGEGTRVYATEDLLLRWTADDRVSIFNKSTYNQQYKFTGETGDNAGGFRKIATDEFVTGNAISDVVSVYPYQEGTKISESEVITVTLPAEQHYAEKTFGLGANTMVSVTEDNFLQYKNVGGYLLLKLYGDGVSVSSIKLRGNNGEKLAGKATVTMPVGGEPAVVMSGDATTEITLTCETPVQLGSSAEESTQFWLVVPPMTFERGFTVTVTGSGGIFEKSTSKTVTLERNNLFKMSPIEVKFSQPKDVIYYTSLDGSIVTPDSQFASSDAFGVNILSNEYINGQGIITFDGDVTSIGDYAFYLCSSLTSITLPNSVTSIGNHAFYNCSSLTSITLPEGVTSIEGHAFYGCSSLTGITIPDSVTIIGNSAFESCLSLTSITIPENVTSIGRRIFDSCSSLTSITIPEGVTSIGDLAFYGCWRLPGITIPEGVRSIGYNAFYGCSSLTSITLPNSVTDIGSYAFYGCRSLTSITIPEGVTSLEPRIFSDCSSLTSITIPEGVKSVEGYAFYGCSSLTSIILPEGVTSIGGRAFEGCSSLTSITIPNSVSEIGYSAFSLCSRLIQITVMPEAPPSGRTNMFIDTNECPIYVPSSSVDVYKTAPYWSDFADRIYAIGTSVAIDLGLPSGLKWASFNLGATKPEEYGDYYAWGETEPYYDNLDPLTWKDGKSKGYGWSSYKWCNVSDVVTLTKYCYMNGYNDYTDTKTVLDLDDDAACLNLGSNWRMPTEAEWTELMENCNWTWTTQNQVNGIVLTGPNGNEIFLPTSGGRWRDSLLDDVGSKSFYWSSSLSPSTPYYARCMHLDSSDFYWTNDNRCRGLSVRPVYAE